MERLKINEPQNYLFETQMKIGVSDLNYGNHLSNDAFLRFAQEARMRFFNHFGYTELNIEGLGSIMADCAIQFLGQGYYGDDLKIQLGISSVSKYGFDLVYKMENTNTNKNLAIIKTAILGFDYKENKVRPIPSEFWKKMNIETEF